MNVDMDQQKSELTYLALGDSYTIGEAVEESERWPVRLAKSLTGADIPVSSPRIIATTGWTTDELQKAIEEANIQATYDMVSLLIGVNNQYRGYPFEQYEREFTELLTTAIGFADNNANKVFVVSIPDYGVTPFGQKKDAAKTAREIDQYNSTARRICEERGVLYINITDISKAALNDNSLVASDDLHPSGKMYAQWTERIFPAVKDLLK